MKEIQEIPAYLPNGVALKDAVKKAKDWLQEVEGLQVGKKCTFSCVGEVPSLISLHLYQRAVRNELSAVQLLGNYNSYATDVSFIDVK